MNKEGLLKSLADTGYNVGFGAKKHFATYDIVEKTPGWIGFLTISFGIFGLIFDELSAKVPSATLLVAGIVSLYISFYRSSEYEEAGKKITSIYNSTRDLYREVQSGADIDEAYDKLRGLEADFYASALSRQILFSDWYAHFKFFAQHQIDWINEQKNFHFWRDMIPASAKLFLVAVSVASLLSLLYYLTSYGYIYFRY